MYCNVPYDCLLSKYNEFIIFCKILSTFVFHNTMQPDFPNRIKQCGETNLNPSVLNRTTLFLFNFQFRPYVHELGQKWEKEFRMGGQFFVKSLFWFLKISKLDFLNFSRKCSDPLPNNPPPTGPYYLDPSMFATNHFSFVTKSNVYQKCQTKCSCSRINAGTKKVVKV